MDPNCRYIHQQQKTERKEGLGYKQTRDRAIPFLTLAHQVRSNKKCFKNFKLDRRNFKKRNFATSEKNDSKTCWMQLIPTRNILLGHHHIITAASLSTQPLGGSLYLYWSILTFEKSFSIFVVIAKYIFRRLTSSATVSVSFFFFSFGNALFYTFSIALQSNFIRHYLLGKRWTWLRKKKKSEKRNFSSKASPLSLKKIIKVHRFTFIPLYAGKVCTYNKLLYTFCSSLCQ